MWCLVFLCSFWMSVVSISPRHLPREEQTSTGWRWSSAFSSTPSASAPWPSAEWWATWIPPEKRKPLPLRALLTDIWTNEILIRGRLRTRKSWPGYAHENLLQERKCPLWIVSSRARTDKLFFFNPSVYENTHHHLFKNIYYYILCSWKYMSLFIFIYVLFIIIFLVKWIWNVQLLCGSNKVMQAFHTCPWSVYLNRISLCRLGWPPAHGGQTASIFWMLGPCLRTTTPI